MIVSMGFDVSGIAKAAAAMPPVQGAGTGAASIVGAAPANLSPSVRRTFATATQQLAQNLNRLVPVQAEQERALLAAGGTWTPDGVILPPAPTGGPFSNPKLVAGVGLGVAALVLFVAARR